MYRVLVVDDEPLAQKSVCSIIDKRSKNYRVVDTAENGQEALEKARNLVPDLIICDIKMPLMSGVELSSVIREELPEICFIIISGYQDFEFARSAIRSGVTDYLLKPIVPAELLKTLKYTETKISEIHYRERNRILRALGNGESVDMAKLERYMPDEEYYGAIIRTNGLPRRFSMDRRREIYSDIYENYMIFGRDEMESLYLIPGKLVGEGEFLHYLNKLQKQQNASNYYTLIYDSRPFTKEKLQEKIKNLYQQLDQRSSVGVTQILNLAEKQNVRTISTVELHKNESKVLTRLETAARTRNPEQIRQEIRLSYEFLEKDHPSQLWMENFTREVLAIMRQYNLCKRSTQESEYLMNDAFFYATSIQTLADSLVDVFLDFEQEECCSKVDSQEYFDMIRNYLEENLGKTITLPDLCHHFGISQTYMSRLFRKYSGNSFNQYLTELRMTQAKKLLSEKPDILIKDVASIVGYEDQFYFSRLFRSYTGKSPSEFLKGLNIEGKQKG